LRVHWSTDMQGNPSRRRFRFGTFEADEITGELSKQGRRLALQGQPFDILVMLLERPGELVTRTQICERLWPDGTFVDFDHSLNTAINKIRDVLGDSAANPRFIETLARRGYRFIAPVQIEQAQIEQAQIADKDATGKDVANQQGAAPTADHASSALAASAAPSEPPSESSLVQELLTGSHEVPRASRQVVRTLFLLLQVMYLSFYLLSLAHLHYIEEMAGATSHPFWIVAGLVVTALIGIPVRLYLISAAAFNAPGLRDKFLRLFALLFPLDELWALTPFLLLPQIGHGLALGLTAILLYAPFAERSLILMGAGAPALAEVNGPTRA